jgi:hypothetical protein
MTRLSIEHRPRHEGMNTSIKTRTTRFAAVLLAALGAIALVGLNAPTAKADDPPQSIVILPDQQQSLGRRCVGADIARCEAVPGDATELPEGTAGTTVTCLVAEGCLFDIAGEGENPGSDPSLGELSVWVNDTVVSTHAPGSKDRGKPDETAGAVDAGDRLNFGEQATFAVSGPSNWNAVEVHVHIEG